MLAVWPASLRRRRPEEAEAGRSRSVVARRAASARAGEDRFVTAYRTVDDFKQKKGSRWKSLLLGPDMTSTVTAVETVRRCGPCC
jgi:hypothetical protein